jgi:hypothetical protein
VYITAKFYKATLGATDLFGVDPYVIDAMSGITVTEI